MESILSCPIALVDGRFRGRAHIGPAEAEELARALAAAGDFRPREGVEADAGRAQPIGIVVVRDPQGGVLRLRRREPDGAGPLHGRAVVWVGGHCDAGDGQGGPPLLRCALRELREELGADAGDGRALRPLGAVRSYGSARARMHFGVAWEWVAGADAGLAPCAEEFMAGGARFADPGALGREAGDPGSALDGWSRALIRHALAAPAAAPGRRPARAAP